MNETVSDAALQQYQRDGFAIFRNVLDPDLVAEARGHVQWLQRRYPFIRPEHFHHPLMRDDAFWVRLVTDERILDLVQRFLGPDLACFTSHYICKPPRDGQAVLWHQDGAYWNLEPTDALTAWVAIDDCDASNGCLQMIPSTHRTAIRDLVLRDEIPNMLCSSIDPRFVDAARAVPIELRAGDVSVHHPRIIHGSEPNTSSRRRCGLDIGYIATSTRIGDTGLYLNPILVRGEAVTGINQYRRWPPYDGCHSIRFRGCEQWNERAAEVNRRMSVVRSAADDLDVEDLTMRMIERLQAGTTKALRAVPTGGES